MTETETVIDLVTLPHAAVEAAVRALDDGVPFLHFESETVYVDIHRAAVVALRAGCGAILGAELRILASGLVGVVEREQASAGRVQTYDEEARWQTLSDLVVGLRVRAAAYEAGAVRARE